jgi:hypothetical protein
MTLRTDDGMMMPGFVIEKERRQIDALIAEIDAANKALKEKIQAGEAEIAEIQARSKREVRERQVQTLAELIRGGHATADERAQAQRIIDLGTRTLAAGGGDSAMRADLARDVGTLKEAFQASPEAQAAQRSAALKADSDNMIRAAQDELDLAHERLQTLKEEGLALVYMRHQQEAITRIAQEQRRLEAGDIGQQDFDQFKKAALQAAAIKDRAAEINQLADQLDQLWDDVIANLESSMASFFSGARGSFKNLFEDVKKMFIRMWAEVVASRIMKSIIGLFSKDKSASADAAATMQVSAGAVMADAAKTQMIAAATMAKAAGVQAEAAGTETARAGASAAKPGGLLYKIAGYTMTAAVGYQIGDMMGQKFGKVGGAIGGAVGGAAAGAVIGSKVLPGIGTAVGAVIGGVAGLVGGLFGSSKKAKEAARQMREAQQQWELALKDFADAATEMPDHVRREKEINRKTLDLMRQGMQAFGIKDPNKTLKFLGFDPNKMTGSPEEIAQVIKKLEQLAGKGGPLARMVGGKHLNSLIAEMKKLAEAQGLHFDALEKARQEQEKTVKDDLAVRELAAKGLDKDAEALRLKLQHEREYQEAEKQGYDAATLAQLRHVQALEAAKQAADGLTTSMLNVPEGFRLAAAAFRAQDSFTPTTSGPPILAGWPGPHPTPTFPTLGPIDDGGRSEDDRDIVLQLDGREVARVAVHHLRRKARQQFGDETRWGEVSEA